MPLKMETPQGGSTLERIKKVALWALTIFMFASGVVFIPSAASVTMILFACISAPIPSVQKFWASKKLTGWLKFLLLVILFALSVHLYRGE